MKRVFKIALSAIFAISLVSCAEEQEYTLEDIELKSVQEWVKVNRPDMEMITEGLYAKIDRKGPSSETIKYENSNWIKYTYQSETLDKNYTYNMYPGVAYDLGTFDYQTHYIPNQMSIYQLLYSGNAAIAYVIADMNVGDSVEIVGTSKFIYSGEAISTTPSGYKGNTFIRDDVPGIIRMKYNSFIEDMNKYERAEVIEYARSKMQIGEKDSVADLSLMYIKKLVEFPKADTIKLDTTVTLRYTGRFLDGFVFDTNVIEVAKENNIYDSKKEYEPVDFSSSATAGGDGSYIYGFTEAVKSMKIGEKIDVVFTSNLGYGTSGTKSGTWIEPNTPLVFTIEVLVKEDEEK